MVIGCRGSLASLFPRAKQDRRGHCDTWSTLTAGAQPVTIRARSVSKCAHSCQVRPSTPALRRSRFFRAVGSVRAGTMGSVRAGTMGSVRSRRFSFSGFMLQRALARLCAVVVAPISNKLWHHFLTRLGLLRRHENNTLDRATDTSTQRQQVRAFVPGPLLNAGAQPVTKRTRTAGQVVRPGSHLPYGFIDSGIAEVLCVSRERSKTKAGRLRRRSRFFSP